MIIQGADKRERHAIKLRLGWMVAAREGTMSDFAEVLGVSRPAVTTFLKMYPELRKALKDGRRKSTLSDLETAERTLMCAQARLGWMRWKDVARTFGITGAGITTWAKAHEDEILECMIELTAPIRRAA